MDDTYWTNWNSLRSRYQDNGYGYMTWAYNNHAAREYFLFGE